MLTNKKTKNQFILALDQGTTSSRALVVDSSGVVVGAAQQEFEQIFPHPGWVEHDAMEILQSQLKVLRDVVASCEIDPSSIPGLGICNQRETTVIWDERFGEPVYNAIVWQDLRTVDLCKRLQAKGLGDYVRQKTGLVIDAYFSATKIKWILDNVDGARSRAEEGKLLFGTVDSWLLWNLTGGAVHATDYSNASRTMLYNIRKLCWDKELLDKFDIPLSMMPKVKPSSHYFGNCVVDDLNVPVAGIAGDQQAALFGQACFDVGDMKNTYGTGCFMLKNTGRQPVYSDHGLLTTIAWGIGREVHYAIEGSVFVAGAAIQWLRDGLQFFEQAHQCEALAGAAMEDNPVYVVPAFAGLGAPHWDMYARGAILGLSRDTGKAEIARATLDSLAYQTVDVAHAMQKDSGIKLGRMKVDGGASGNDLLMQFQADMLNVEVIRPKNIESTAMGAAYLAGVTVGLWTQEDIRNNQEIDKVFRPSLDGKTRIRKYRGWKRAVSRAAEWAR